MSNEIQWNQSETRTFTSPRRSLSSNHLSVDNQAADVVKFLKVEHPDVYARILGEFPELERATMSGSQYDTEAMGVDEEWGSWLVDALEATGLVTWEDGEPYVNGPLWMVQASLLEDDPFVILDWKDGRIIGADIYEAMAKLEVFDLDSGDELPLFRYFIIWKGGVYADICANVESANSCMDVGIIDQWVKTSLPRRRLNLSNGRDVNDSSPYILDDFKRNVLAHAKATAEDEPESVEHNLTCYGFQVWPWNAEHSQSD